MFDMKSVLFVLPLCMFAVVFSGPVNHLDVFIARRELKRFFQEFDIGDFYIVRKGVIDNFVQNKATGFLPPIDPEIQTLELKFQSKYKIRFPCTRRKTGTASLRVKMEFMLPAKKRSPVAEFDLNLRRSCEKAQEIVARKTVLAKTNYICSKKCDRNNVMRRFCLSDFAIRARVEKSTTGKNGRPVHKVRVTKYYKRSRVPLAKKINIEITGREITCKCEPLQEKKTYLILGKENSRTRTFFLDDYTYAIEWSDGGKKLAKLHKKRNTCPRRFGTRWYPIEKA